MSVDEAPRRRGRPPKAQTGGERVTAPEYQMGAGDDSGRDQDDGPQLAPVVEGVGPVAEDDPGLSDDDADAGCVLADGWSDFSVPDGEPPFWSGGKPVIVAGLIGIGIPVMTPAYLHASRRWGGSAMRWVPYYQWRILNSVDPVPFTPICWARYN